MSAPKPEKSLPRSETRSRYRVLFLVLIAAVLGMAAGSVAVYLREAPDGNASLASLASLASQSCRDAPEAAEALKPLAVGDVAALVMTDRAVSLSALGFTAATGAPTTLDAWAGKVVLLNLWATWCVPCREEMPALGALQDALGGEAFEVVTVNIDTRGEEGPKAFLAEIGVSSLAFNRDPTTGVFQALKAEGLAFGMPTTVLVDAKGCLLGHMAGPADWAGSDARALIAAALAR